MTTLLTGDEHLLLHQNPTNHRVLEFWRWAFSDLRLNITRGVFAEYIVATAVGMELDKPRSAWADVDLTLRDGLKIEVKSAAYVQSWEQSKPSTISFGYAATGVVAESLDKVRVADVYVFCLHSSKVRDEDMLNLDHWRFYVVATSVLNARTRSQSSITLPSLEALVEAVGYAELKTAIYRAGEANRT